MGKKHKILNRVWSAVNSYGWMDIKRILKVTNLNKMGDSVYLLRNGGIPYRNAQGEVVMSGSIADRDCKLRGCYPEVQKLYDMARKNEPRITLDMLDIAYTIGAHMEGLQYSVKTATSVVNKIERLANDAVKRGEVPKRDVQYIYDSGDLVRYIEVVSHKYMANDTRKTLDLLRSKGYTINEVDNKYLDKNGRYKAIHVNATSPTGQIFEIQIHSKETLETNRATHLLYEEWRSPDISQDKKDKLFSRIKKMYDALPVPKNIRSIKNYRMQGTDWRTA